jgi:hydrogenase small subunit
MSLTRQDFLMASAALAAAFGLQGAEALAQESGFSVIWLRAQSCSGCSAALLDTICFDTIDGLLENEEDFNFRPADRTQTLNRRRSTGAGNRAGGNHVLVVEGAVPVDSTANQCYLWPGLTAASGIKAFASRTPHVIEVGACALAGDVGGCPNPGRVVSVQSLLGPSQRVITLPGCPIDPDWLIATIAHLLRYGSAPALDSAGRPTVFASRPRELWPLPQWSQPDTWHRSVA